MEVNKPEAEKEFGGRNVLFQRQRQRANSKNEKGLMCF
jgi:hypothetical protein